MAWVTGGTSSKKFLGHHATMTYTTCAPTGRHLLWRGIEYEQIECKQGPFPASLWLVYRGIKYRPAAQRDQLSWLG